VKKNLHIIIASVIFSLILWGSVSLSKDYYVTIQLPVRITNFPEGYASGTRIPKIISIKIKGNGWKLIAVNLGTESEFQVPAGPDSGKKFINLYNYLSENQWLTSDMEVLEISPDTISFFVEKVIEKKLAVEPSLELNFSPGYGLASEIRINPESTLVTGPRSLLSSLKSIPTINRKFSNLDSRRTEIIELRNLPGMKYETGSIAVTLNVQKIVDKNFENLPVEVIDVPGDRDVVLLPNRVSIGVRGGIDILGRLNLDDFRAYVFYRDVVLDTIGSVTPRLETPQNIRLFFTRPERLRYIIKKF
jgi:hypothetical protein